jgi:hypothetical protein
MGGAAGGGEGARDGEDDDFFVGPFCEEKGRLVGFFERDWGEGKRRVRGVVWCDVMGLDMIHREEGWEKKNEGTG